MQTWAVCHEDFLIIEKGSYCNWMAIEIPKRWENKSVVRKLVAVERKLETTDGEIARYLICTENVYIC